jgi:hypothetical protein
MNFGMKFAQTGHLAMANNGSKGKKVFNAARNLKQDEFSQ